MADKMKIQLLLTAVNKLSPVIKKVTSDLKGFSRDATKTLNNLNKLIKLIGSSPKNGFGKKFASDIRKSNSEAAKLKKTLESISKTKSPKFDVPKIKPPKIDISGVSNSPKTKSPTGNEELDKLFNKKRRSKSTIDRLANINERILEPASEIKNVWKEQINSVRELTDETKELYLAQSKFKLLNLSPEENKKAFEAVTNVVRKFGTVTQKEGIETLTDLHTAFGHLEPAIEALEKASQYRFSMKTLFADKFSDSEIETQIQSLYKVLELTGKVSKGKKEMDAGFNVLTQMVNATGGRITGSELLLTARRGGTSLQNLTPEGWRHLALPIQELGGSGAGVALETMAAALVGGIMKQSASERFDHFGLLDRSKIEYGKGQKIKRVLPGANKLGDALMQDPLKSIDMLRDAMAAKGVDVNNQEAVNKELYILFQNRNARKMASLYMNQRGQVLKEAELAQNAQGNDQMYEKIDDNLKKLQEVENAWIDLKAKAGIPLIQTFGKLAEAATPVLNFFAEHETLTQWGLAALIAGKGLSGIVQTAAALKTSNMLSFFSSATTSANSTSLALANTSTKANALKNSLGGIGNYQFGIGVKVLSVIGLYEAIQYALDKAKEAGESQSRNFADAKKNYIEWTKTDANLKTQKDYEFQANSTWAVALNSGLGLAPQKGEQWDRLSVLEKSFNAIKQTLLYPVSKYYGAENKFTGFGYVHDKNTYASGFRQTSPQLADPKIMLEVLKQLPSRVTDTTERNTVRDSLKLSFPESYTQAVLKLSEGTSGLTTSFAELSKPTGELTASTQGATNGMNNFASSANSIASRLNSLQIQPPTFSPIQVPIFSQQNQVNPLFKPFPFVGGRARGGSMQKGHTYQINEIGQEFFTPASSGSMVSNDALRSSGKQSSASGSTVINNNTFHITGKNADEIADEVVKSLEILSSRVSRIESETTPRATTRKMFYEMDRLAGRH